MYNLLKWYLVALIQSDSRRIIRKEEEKTRGQEDKKTNRQEERNTRNQEEKNARRECVDFFWKYRPMKREQLYTWKGH